MKRGRRPLPPPWRRPSRILWFVLAVIGACWLTLHMPESHMMRQKPEQNGTSAPTSRMHRSAPVSESMDADVGEDAVTSSGPTKMDTAAPRMKRHAPLTPTEKIFAKMKTFGRLLGSQVHAGHEAGHAHQGKDERAGEMVPLFGHEGDEADGQHQEDLDFISGDGPHLLQAFLKDGLEGFFVLEPLLAADDEDHHDGTGHVEDGEGRHLDDEVDILHGNTGGVGDDLKGKKVAMTWAYSPSYGKPLSVPQGVIGLFTRFGMDVTLAHPEGYDVMPEVEEVARKNCEKYGSKFHKTNSMAEAFKDADIVYPKSWAPFKAMEKRSELYVKGDQKGIDELEKQLLAQNAEHKDWTCSEEMMKLTKDGKALYLHCLPADISGLSCPEGEVDNSVFDRYLVPLYKQASYKPYIIAAMIFLAQVKAFISLKLLSSSSATRMSGR